MNAKKKNAITLIIYLVIVITVISSLMFMFLNVRNTKHKAYNQLHNEKTTYKELNSKYRDKYEKLFNLYHDSIDKSSDPKISSITLSNINYSNTQTALDKFFNIYLTYNNEKEFDKRKTTLLKDNLITKSFANTKNFVAPKDNSGSSYIDNAGLSSKFIDGSYYSDKFVTNNNNITVMARVSFQSKYRDSWGSDATNLYKIDFNQKTGTVNDVQKVAVNSSKAYAADNDDANN